MKINISTDAPTKQKTDLLAVFPEHLPSLHLIFGDVVKDALKDEGFEDAEGKQFHIHSHGKIAAKNVVVTGIGKKKLTVENFQKIGAAIARQALSMKSTSIAIVMPQKAVKELGLTASAQAMVTGVMLGSYVFNRHKAADEQKKHRAIDSLIFCIAKDDEADTQKGIDAGRVSASATIVARDLINEPSSVTTPTYLSDMARDLAKAHGYTVEILDRKAMEQLGMNALLAIAKGSDEEPRFIKLEYHHLKATKTICLVGKGITFDSGGLSLKPENSMETMKCDMAGAAAILGVFSALSELKPTVNVVGLIAATENMPSGKAIKPGDVVTALNGKTIEIMNTDAEGRVVLADAVSYAEKFVKPDEMIDLATLTGACMVALGEDIAGLFVNDETLGVKLKAAAAQSGERIWELPLVASYNDLMKSQVADIRNISKTRYGGAITGALFIGAFVKDSLPWAHLDIAGPAFAEKDEPLNPYGGTGFGVRLLLSYLTSSR